MKQGNTFPPGLWGFGGLSGIGTIRLIVGFVCLTHWLWGFFFWGFGFFGLVVCFLESGCECLCDALFFVENLVRGHPFFG